MCAYSPESLAMGLIVLVDGRNVSNALCKSLLEYVAVSCAYIVMMYVHILYVLTVCTCVYLHVRVYMSMCMHMFCYWKYSVLYEWNIYIIISFIRKYNCPYDTLEISSLNTMNHGYKSYRLLFLCIYCIHSIFGGHLVWWTEWYWVYIAS